MCAEKQKKTFVFRSKIDTKRKSIYRNQFVRL